MIKSKELSFLGLAAKAGKVVSGGLAVEKAIKAGKAHLVLIADDASNNTKKEFTNMCAYYKVPLYMVETKEELGRAIGKEYRASLAVTDSNFAVALKGKMERIVD